jgi:hypothetical protein
MIRNIFTFIFLFSFVSILIACNSSSSSNMKGNMATIGYANEQVDNADIDTKTANESTTVAQISVDSIASGFVENLETGGELSLFFNDSWTFVYHEDNRCDGSTDGQIDNLKSTQIDSVIRLEVKNDGDGWACDKKVPRTFVLAFDLKKKVTDWDRFDIPHYENQEANIVYVVGAGESDYLKLHYNDNNLIVKLEYRSEDPG